MGVFAGSKAGGGQSKAKNNIIETLVAATGEPVAAALLGIFLAKYSSAANAAATALTSSRTRHWQ